MGTFGELMAEITAKQLESILLDGIATGNSDIIEFNTQVYEMYLSEIAEIWSEYNIPEIIQQYYKK